MTLSKPQKLWKLFQIYFLAGTFTFAGGLAMLPVIQRSVIDRYHMMDNDSFLEYAALCQTLPGVIALNNAILVGKHVAGTLGSVVAGFGACISAFVLMLLATIALSFVPMSGWVQGAMRGVCAASAALILASAITLGGKQLKKAFPLIVAVCAFIAIVVLKISVLYVVLAGGVTGLAYTRINDKFKDRPARSRRRAYAVLAAAMLVVAAVLAYFADPLGTRRPDPEALRAQKETQIAASYQDGQKALYDWLRALPAGEPHTLREGAAFDWDKMYVFQALPTPEYLAALGVAPAQLPTAEEPGTHLVFVKGDQLVMDMPLRATLQALPDLAVVTPEDSFTLLEKLGSSNEEAIRKTYTDQGIALSAATKGWLLDADQSGVRQQLLSFDENTVAKNPPYPHASGAGVWSLLSHLGNLFLMFFRIGILGFGGGYAMLSMISAEAAKLGITAAEIATLLAIDLVVPGPIAINAATYAGYLYMGTIGAATATLGVMLPCYCVCLPTMAFIDQFRRSNWLPAMQSGIRPAAVGLIAAASVTIGAGVLINEGMSLSMLFSAPLGVFSLVAVLIFLTALIAHLKFKVDAILLTVLAGVAGAFLL